MSGFSSKPKAKAAVGTTREKRDSFKYSNEDAFGGGSYEDMFAKPPMRNGGGLNSQKQMLAQDYVNNAIKPSPSKLKPNIPTKSKAKPKASYNAPPAKASYSYNNRNEDSYGVDSMPVKAPKGGGAGGSTALFKR